MFGKGFSQTNWETNFLNKRKSTSNRQHDAKWRRRRWTAAHSTNEALVKRANIARSIQKSWLINSPCVWASRVTLKTLDFQHLTIRNSVCGVLARACDRNIQMIRFRFSSLSIATKLVCWKIHFRINCWRGDDMRWVWFVSVEKSKRKFNAFKEAYLFFFRFFFCSILIGRKFWNQYANTFRSCFARNKKLLAITFCLPLCCCRLHGVKCRIQLLNCT